MGNGKMGTANWELLINGPDGNCDALLADFKATYITGPIVR